MMIEQFAAPQQVTKAVQNASARTGVDFSYLMKQAEVESSFKTDAKARSSSATGLYQFIDQTWLRMVKAHGAEHGKADWANAITQGRNGHFSVSSGLKSTILNARKDADFSALMAGEFASENSATLKAKTGKDANATDLYMAHFLGAHGASTFLNAMDENPLQSASHLFPAAAKSNRSVFYNANGTSRSLAEVYDRFADKFDGISAGKNPVVTASAKSEPILTANLMAAPVPDHIDPLALLGVQPARVHNASSSSYMNIQSPVQTMIGNDLLSAPLLSLFTVDKAEQDTSKLFAENNNRRGFGNFSFNA